MPSLSSCAAILTALVLTVNAADAQKVRIGIPERDNLQYMAFWIAQGAGFFASEGLDVEVVVPDVPNQSGMILMQQRVDVALLQPPVYLGLMAEQHPFVLFANLLANDPINLILKGEVASAITLDPKAPLAERLRALKGLRIGVAPEPQRRLRLLFAEAGLKADEHLQIVIRRAEDQTDAWTSGAVDGLYTHTPVLQDALIRLGAVMAVNQSAGDVAALRNGQIHSLGATKAYVAAHPDVIQKVTRAIARAQSLLKRDATAAAAALVKAGIQAPSPAHLRLIVDLYRPAVPPTPHVSAAAVERNAHLYPARPTMPDFTKVRASDFVDTSFAGARPEADQRLDLGVVEVTAAPASAALAPMTHTIDATTIRHHQALTVKEAIELLPGVAVDHRSPRNQSGIAIGGFDMRQVPLYLDGVPAYQPFDGFVDLGRYLTSDVSEVQVAKGYASPLLGPNVLGGVVNVVTRLPQRNLEGDARFGVSNGRQVNAGVRIAGRWRNVSGAASADHLASDYISAGGARRQNSDQRDSRGSLRVAWAPRPSDMYVVSASSQQGASGVPPYDGQFAACPTGTTVAATTPCVTPRYWRWPQWDAASYYVNSHTALGRSSSLRLRAFSSVFANRQEMFDDATYTSMVNANAGRLQNHDRSSGVSGELESRGVQGHALAASFFLKHDSHRERTTMVSRTDVVTTTPEQRHRDRLSSFGFQDAITFTDRLRATVGVSADRLEPLAAQDLTADRLGVTPFPLAEPVWTVNPVGAVTFVGASAGTLSVTATRKSRFPTIKDRYSYRAGRALPNPQLKPERALTWTAAYSREMAPRTAVQVEWYRSDVTDEIENIFFLSPLCAAAGGGGGGGGRGAAGTCQQAVNVGVERHHGVSLTLRSTALPHVTVDANYSFLRRRIDGSTAAFPQGTPTHKSLASATISLPRRGAGVVAIRHQRGIVAMSDNGLPLPAASFMTVDAGATMPVRSGVSIQGGVKNLLDRGYYYWEGFPEPGRNAYLTLRFTF